MHTSIYYKIKEIFTKTSIIWENKNISQEKARSFAEEYISPEPASKDGLEYSLAHYGEIYNKQLREDRIESEILQIEDLINKYHVKKDIIVYRGICSEVYNMMILNAKNIQDIDLLEKSFLQTSLVKGHESTSQIRLRIFVPAGTSAIYLGDVNDELHYYEVDIQRGAQLKIISIDKSYINCKLIKTL